MNRAKLYQLLVDLIEEQRTSPESRILVRLHGDLWNVAYLELGGEDEDGHTHIVIQTEDE